MNTHDQNPAQNDNILPAGHYRARADAATLQFGRSANGNEQVALTFDITDRKAEGQRITWIGTFAEGKATEIAVAGLMAAGWTGENLTAGDGLGAVECSLKVSHKQNEQTGKVFANVDFVNPAGGGFAFKTKLDQGGVMALESKLGGAVMAAREKLGAPRQQGPAPRRAASTQAQRGDAWDGQGADPNAGDDEIPW